MTVQKTIIVTQQVKELVFDIQNKAYLTGQAREAEGKINYESAANMQASDDAESSYQIRHSLANAFSTLKSMLGEYLTDDKTTSDNLINTEIDKDGVLTLAFALPSNYNNASTESLGSSIHAYLVNTALGDWFAITNREDAEIYISYSVASLEKVKQALYKRSRPERPTYS